MEIKSIALALAAIMILAGGLIGIQAQQEETGNGAPSGFHYNVNIIGVPHGMQEGWEGGNGARIFVDREESTFFYVKGLDEPFQILDHDATDGSCGSSREEPGLIMPYSGGKYQVKICVRLLGPIDSSVKWKSWYWNDSITDWVVIDEFTLTRANKKFQVKTDSLLADGFEDTLWELSEKDNFKHLQMRIYMDEV